MDRWLYVVGLVVLVVALTIVLTLPDPWLSGRVVREELAKVGIQVVVFGLAGGGVKLLLDRQAEDRKFRADLLERLGQAHKVVYRVRRLLPGSDAVKARELLGELMDVRQDLGATTHVMRGKIANVSQAIDAMREYIEAVVQAALAADDSSGRGPYAEFIDWKTLGAYETGFKMHYRNAKRLIDPKSSQQGAAGR
jgi:hypothetical protein